MNSYSEVTEQKLSCLIAELSAWLESEQSEFFVFKGVNLRGSFERYIYFETMSSPYALKPLLDLTKPWRIATPDSELTDTYDDYWQIASDLSFFRKRIVSFMRWARIARDFLSSIMSFTSLRKTQSPKRSGIGFFAINERFVDFFQPLAMEFQASSCIFFSSHPSLVEKRTMAYGFWLASLPTPNLFIRDLNLSVYHPLFSVYYRLCFFYLRAYQVLEQYRPMILLFSEGTSHYDDLMARAAKQLGVITIRVQSGRAGVLHSGYRNMCFDVMLCWSDDFVERYQSVSPEPVYYVTGSPLLDEVYQLRKLPVANTPVSRVIVFTQPVSAHINEQDYLALIKVAEDILKRNVSIEIVVRKHPVDRHKGFEILQSHYSARMKFMNSPEYSLAETLAYSECAVGFFSTTLSEAAACGVVPIIFNRKAQHSVYPYPEQHGAAIVVYSVNDAVNKIINIIDFPEKFDHARDMMGEFSLRFFGPSDGKAKKRMIDLIDRYAVKPDIVE